MASENSVYVIYSVDDGVEWCDYLVKLLTQVELDVTAVEMDSSGSLSLPVSRRGTVLVLLASPGFLQSLIADVSDSLDEVVNQAADNADLVLLFLCGPLMKHLEETDCRGRRLSERFHGLASWTTMTHDELKQLPRTVCDLFARAERAARKTPPAKKQRPRETEKTAAAVTHKKQPKLRPKINFKLFPDEVRCEVWNQCALNKYVGPPYCRAEMYAGRVACCPCRVILSMRSALY